MPETIEKKNDDGDDDGSDDDDGDDGNIGPAMPGGKKVS